MANKLIVLDPGHGGSDPGAVGFDLKEKDLNLKMAFIVGETLLNEYEGVTVKFTRKTDVFVTLADRAKFANDLNANYFASFHVNAFNGNVGGFQTYIYNATKSQVTKSAQDIIHAELKKFYAQYGKRDAGKRSANFAVLRKTNMSAILFENLFIDYEPDANFLKDPAKFTVIARTCAHAIAKALNLTPKTKPEPTPEPENVEGLVNSFKILSIEAEKFAYALEKAFKLDN